MPVKFTTTAHSQLEQGIDSAEVDEIATYFDLLEQPRRLVVVGDPGAGKTVAATYLVHGLIQRRSELLAATRRAAEPVPVRVNAAGWDGGQEFSAWLITRLEVDYCTTRPCWNDCGAILVRWSMFSRRSPHEYWKALHSVVSSSLLMASMAAGRPHSLPNS